MAQAVASLVGVVDLQEPMDLIYADEASLARLAERMADLRMPLSLERVPQDSPAIAALRRAFAGRGLVVERPRPCFPFITLSQAWEDPPRQLSSRRRSDFRRAWKRAEAFGKVTCDVMTPELARLDKLFDAVLEIEGRSWKGEAGTALHSRSDPIGLLSPVRPRRLQTWNATAVLVAIWRFDRGRAVCH